MANNRALQFLRGSGHDKPNILNQGQPYFDYTNNLLYIGDGKTALRNLNPLFNNEFTIINNKIDSLDRHKPDKEDCWLKPSRTTFVSSGNSNNKAYILFKDALGLPYAIYYIYIPKAVKNRQYTWPFRLSSVTAVGIMAPKGDAQTLRQVITTTDSGFSFPETNNDIDMYVLAFGALYPFQI